MAWRARLLRCLDSDRPYLRNHFVRGFAERDESQLRIQRRVSPERGALLSLGRAFAVDLLVQPAVPHRISATKNSQAARARSGAYCFRRTPPVSAHNNAVGRHAATPASVSI